MLDTNIDVGDCTRFGFQIAPQPFTQQIRAVTIFMGGTNLTPDNNLAYLPSFIGQLNTTSEWLKRKIDYLKYEQLFSSLNITEIHNSLVHNHLNILTDDEWDIVYRGHRFGDWGETTDDFTAFLIPYFDRLYLTYQLRNDCSLDFDILDVVEGIEITPHYLITTIDAAIVALANKS